MEDTKWSRWLRTVTKEDTVRGIARAAKVTHPTVSRWISKGVPPATVWELTLRLHGDPIEALIVLGRITPEQVADLNHAALVSYAPDQALTWELHRRATQRDKEWPLSLSRSDVIPRPPFRLVAK